ncbi:MAG: polysaccharide deacetylase family protein [Solirubrobacteraceae bacterium]
MQLSPGSLSLTFDDGPDGRWTPAVLDALARCGATATFFMLGERVLADPDTARAVCAAGHDVQLHGFRHVRHSELDEREIELDAARAMEALACVEVCPALWRTPWGVRTAATSAVAARLGLTLVDWTLDTHDWRGDPAGAMFARACDQLVPGAVVLMHDALGPGARRAGCQSTVELIEPLVVAARARGLRVQPIAAAQVAPCGVLAAAGGHRAAASIVLAGTT